MAIFICILPWLHCSIKHFLTVFSFAWQQGWLIDICASLFSMFASFSIRKLPRSTALRSTVCQFQVWVLSVCLLLLLWDLRWSWQRFRRRRQCKQCSMICSVLATQPLIATELLIRVTYLVSIKPDHYLRKLCLKGDLSALSTFRMIAFLITTFTSIEWLMAWRGDLWHLIVIASRSVTYYSGFPLRTGKPWYSHTLVARH